MVAAGLRCALRKPSFPVVQPESYVLAMVCGALLTMGACDSSPSRLMSQDLPEGAVQGTIRHGQTERSYILYIPENYTGSEPVPLVLNYHGYESNALGQLEYGDFRALANEHGFLVLHPMGSLLSGVSHWNVGGWTTASTVDDVDFTEVLLAAITAQYQVDSLRIYATGMSNGGFMSFLLACQLSQRIAAIASVTGSMTPETYAACRASRPVPVLQVHGTADEVVPYDGDSWTRPVPTAIKYWVDANRCAAVPDMRDFPDTEPTDGSTVRHTSYGSCDQGVSVEHYQVIGGGHTWPGSGSGYPGTNYDMDASTEIWAFFDRFDLTGSRQ